tara:strand:- start:488 stop:835 length:348 start_codon:yes stop_codon:yes gene_type:complete
MYKLHFLKKENDLNKIIKAQKKERSRLSILFTSLWDPYSQRLVEELKKKHGENQEGSPLYVVDSFYLPHSFVIYKTTKLPHLVHLTPRGSQSEDYLPIIWDQLIENTHKRKRRAN